MNRNVREPSRWGYRVRGLAVIAAVAVLGGVVWRAVGHDTARRAGHVRHAAASAVDRRDGMAGPYARIGRNQAK